MDTNVSIAMNSQLVKRIFFFWQRINKIIIVSRYNNENSQVGYIDILSDFLEGCSQKRVLLLISDHIQPYCKSL
jgi:hypoxanthine-guanine phosphoribosyltransferase